jgi:hypothetical protein
MTETIITFLTFAPIRIGRPIRVGEGCPGGYAGEELPEGSEAEMTG